MLTPAKVTTKLTRFIPVALSAIALTFSSFSPNLHAMPQAPTDTVSGLVTACKAIAIEDKLPRNEMETFILECVNDQLTELGYPRINSLPV